jgi:hypothetical protein
MARRAQKNTIFLILATAIILACVPTPASVPTPIPIFDPNSINTVIALTAGSAATQTARMVPPTYTPTVTLIPANILIPTETPTVTFVFFLPTLTPTIVAIQPGSSGEQYECQILSQTPAENTTMGKGQPFETRWLVANIGTNVWDSDSMDYRYISGDKIHLTAAYDLSQSVSPGESTELVVKMKAPTYSGTFNTRWKLNIGKTQFCAMKLTIIVNK